MEDLMKICYARTTFFLDYVRGAAVMDLYNMTCLGSSSLIGDTLKQ